MRKRKAFTITPFGILFICFSALFSTIGLYRGELGSLLLGSALALYGILAFVCAALARIASSSLVYTARFDGTGGLWITPLPREATTRVFTVLLQNLALKTYTVILKEGISVSAPASKEERRSEHIPLSRGRYEINCAFLSIHDPASLVSFTIQYPRSYFPQGFSVLPIPEYTPREALPPGQSQDVFGRSTYKRAEELSEIRAYHPGDDPRKINWKVYAHTGELAVREGELMPPPAVEYLFVFNTEAIKAGSENRLLFNMLINRCASLALELLGEKKNVSIMTENGPIRIQHDSPTAIESILEALAEPSLSSTPKGDNSFAQWNVCPRDSGITLFFSLPVPECNLEPMQNRIVFFGPRGQVRSPSLLDRMYRLLFTGNAQLPQNCPRFANQLERSLSAFSQGGHDARLM